MGPTKAPRGEHWHRPKMWVQIQTLSFSGSITQGRYLHPSIPTMASQFPHLLNERDVLLSLTFCDFILDLTVGALLLKT